MTPGGEGEGIECSQSSFLSWIRNVKENMLNTHCTFSLLPRVYPIKNFPTVDKYKLCRAF